MDVWDLSNLPEYSGLMDKVQAARERFTRNPSAPELAAAMVFTAANDESDRLRYLVGADAKRLWRLRRWLGYRTQMRITRRVLGV
jgi:alkanesulfonate monooxygenase SsuD/methylene tetrahydromethanopterin reductase-like flavin-dependent oxidoreductase (luciferase family)